MVSPKYDETVGMGVVCCVIDELVFSSSLIILTFETSKVLQSADHRQQHQRRLGSSSASSTPRLSTGTSSNNSTPASSLSTSSRNSSHQSSNSRRVLVEMTRTTSTSNKASATEFQEGLEAAQRRQNSDKEVTILTSKLEELKKTAAESNKLRRELTACDKKIAKLEKTINTLETRLNADGTASTVLTDSIKEKEKVIKELQLLVTQLQGALRKNGTVHESELNRDLVEQTFYAAKIYLFRNVKFFEDDEDAEEKTKMLAKYLPKGVESLGDLSVEEYATMYKQAANQGIQAAKQSVQAEGKKAAGGTFIFSVFGYIVLANLRNFVFEFTDYIFVIVLCALFSLYFTKKFG